MGTGDGEHYSQLRTFRQNEEALVNEFKVTRNGYFGQKGRQKGVRQIDSDNPLATAEKFASIAAMGGKTTHVLANGGFVKVLADGSCVTFRPTSRSASPAVDLKIIDSVHVVSQKIHFESKD